MLSAEERQEIEAALAHIGGDAQRAGLDALAIVQRRRGWVSDEALADLGDFLGLTVHELDSVATFYNHIFRRPVGRHVIRICDSISCYICGYETIRGCLERRLGVRPGQTTLDDRFTLITIPCLGACDRAPAMMVDEELHGDLTEEKIDAILARYA
jgi:NADH-quinone oxidoreductase subunit E